jgi:P27 family predicted phage terminase small subunit
LIAAKFGKTFFWHRKARMGRNAKPPAEKQLTGNAGKRPPRAAAKATKEKEATPIPDSIAPPDWLVGKTSISEWHRLSAHLQRSHVLAETDRTTLGLYCMALQRWVTAQQDMVVNGTTFKSVSKHGELLRINPSFRIAESAAREMARLSVQLGLGALARFRLGGAAANVGVQLDLFGGAVDPNYSGKPDERTQKTESKEDPSSKFFSYH